MLLQYYFIILLRSSPYSIAPVFSITLSFDHPATRMNYCIVVSIYYFMTLLLHYFITPLTPPTLLLFALILDYSIDLLVYGSTVMLLYPTTQLIHFTSIRLLYYFSILSFYYSITLLLYYSLTLLLDYSILHSTTSALSTTAGRGS